MDKLARYREIIRQLIFEYAGHKPANGQIETEAVIDLERDHYEVYTSVGTVYDAYMVRWYV